MNRLVMIFNSVNMDLALYNIRVAVKQFNRLTLLYLFKLSSRNLNFRDEIMAHKLLEPWPERSRKDDLQIHRNDSIE